MTAQEPLGEPTPPKKRLTQRLTQRLPTLRATRRLTQRLTLRIPRLDPIGPWARLGLLVGSTGGLAYGAALFLGHAAPGVVRFQATLIFFAALFGLLYGAVCGAIVGRWIDRQGGLRYVRFRIMHLFLATAAVALLLATYRVCHGLIDANG